MLKKIILTIALLASPAFASEVTLGEDGLHKPTWLNDTFLDMREDLEEANALGLRLAIIVEQRGCIYCTMMHNEVFPIPEIDALIRENYYFVQINMFGDLEVTDFDGEVLTERNIVKKWGVFFTPTTLFLPEEVPEGQSVSEAAVSVMPGAFGKWMTLNMLTWVADHGYDGDEHFQKYHARMFDSQRN